MFSRTRQPTTRRRGVITGAPSGPVLEQIETQVLEETASTIDFTAIPTTYEYLVLRGHTRSTAASTAAELALRLGGAAIDTGNNYQYAHYHVTGGIASSASDGKLAIGRYTIPGALATAGVFGEFETVIHAATGLARLVRSGGRYQNVAGGMGGIWTNTTDAIEKIRVFDNLNGSFVIGSVFTLYGTDDPAFIQAAVV